MTSQFLIMKTNFTKALFLFSLIFLINTNLHSQYLNINEFMSANDDFLADKDGEYNDWIELYNNDNQAINLQGYSLSDDASNLNKWIFPDVTIPAKGFLLVFASGKDILDTTELHTNFKLKQEGEPVLLSLSNQTISTILPVQIPTNKSFGSIQDGNHLNTIFQNPTPNATNGNGQSIYVSRRSGFYTDELMLTLISSKSNQKIHYTLNGKIPTTSDKNYVSPLLIKDNSNRLNNFSNIPTTPLEGPDRLQNYIWQQPENVYKSNIIRYGLFENDSLISPIYSKTYFVDSTIQNRYSYPIISLITDSLNLFDYEKGIYIPGKTFDEIGFGANDEYFHPIGNYHNQGVNGERNVHFTYLEPDGKLGFETDAGMRIRGYGSPKFPQKSLNIYFRKEYGINEIDYPIFENTTTNKRLVLRNSGNDFIQTHIRDAFMQSLLKPLDMELQDFQPTIVFINGEYWGIHNIREKYDKFYFENRYDIDEDDLTILGICGSEEHGNNAEYTQLMDYIYEYNLSEDVHYNYISDKVDIPNFIDYQIAEIFYANYDWPCNNNKMWKTNAADSKWRFLIYDLDMSFHLNEHTHYDSLGMQHATALYNRWNLCECSNIMFIKLLENETFKTLFIETFEEYLNTIFYPNTVIEKIETFKHLFLPEMQEHINRWNYPNSLSAWYEEIERLEKFAINRPCFVKDDLMNFFDLETFDYQCIDENDFQKEYNLFVYPNPSKGDISIRNNESNSYLIGDLTITNANGQTVFYQKNIVLEDDNTVDLNLSNLPNGVYFITCQNVDFIITKKLVLVR